MANAKVSLNGVTLIDMTDATATSADILSGKTAYGADGSLITGTATNSTEVAVITDEADINGGTIRTITVAEAMIAPITIVNNKSSGTTTNKRLKVSNAVRVSTLSNGYKYFEEYTAGVAGGNTSEINLLWGRQTDNVNNPIYIFIERSTATSYSFSNSSDYYVGTVTDPHYSSVILDVIRMHRNETVTASDA